MEAAQEPCHDIGRAALLRRLDIKAVRQHGPTKKRFMDTKRVNSQWSVRLLAIPPSQLMTSAVLKAGL